MNLPSEQPAKSHSPRVILIVAIVGAMGIAAFLWPSKQSSSGDPLEMEPATITFNDHVAPIVHAKCAPCHWADQSAPFELLTYSDVQKRGEQIVEVITSGFMPPWLPESIPHFFQNDRRLTDTEMETITRWVDTGAIEGDPADAPSVPTWSTEWALGEPDLIVELPEAYTLPADGFDVYRNFVIPVPVDQPRWVRTAEIRPGNARIVHHGVMMIDPTSASREADALEEEIGFGGSMTTGNARLPDGHFVGWAPGKEPAPGNDQLAWALNPGTDIVLQLHMRPTGKPESIQPRIGLYFSDVPPQLQPYALVLRTKNIDIEPGDASYEVTDSYTLPVDAFALNAYPHSHYLGKRVVGTATQPDGTTMELLRIEAWDFNWQDEYRFTKPVFLPKGTELRMEWTFDNSAENENNPRPEPERIVYGQNSTDEMAELMFQLVPRDANDLAVLSNDFGRRSVLREIARQEQALAASPDDFSRHFELGVQRLKLGHLPEARYHYLAYLEQAASSGEHGEQSALVHSDLAAIAQQEGDPEEAKRQLQLALPLWREFDRTNNLAKVHLALGNIFNEEGDIERSLDSFRAASTSNPENPEAHLSLAWALLTAPDQFHDPVEAAIHAEHAAELTNRQDPTVLRVLGGALSASGRTTEGRETFDQAIELAIEVGATELVERLRMEQSHIGTTPTQ